MAAVDTVIISTTERDRPLAIYQGHSYVQDDVLGNHITYRCRRRGDNCLGRMHIYKFHPYNIKQHPSEHNHPPQTDGEIGAYLARRRMNQMATDHVHTNGEIHTSVFAQLTDNEATHIATKNACKRAMCRAASKHYPSQSRSVRNFVLVGSWRQTIKGDDWVVYESPSGLHFTTNFYAIICYIILHINRYLYIIIIFQIQVKYCPSLY